MISLTTDEVATHERVEYWEDVVSRHVTPMRMQPSPRTAFRGQVRARSIGSINVAEVSGQGIHASHTRREVGDTSRHLYAACVNLEGNAAIRHRGKELELRQGDVFITDSRHEFALDLGCPWRHLVLSLPTNWLDARVPSPESVGGTVVRSHPLMRLWANHLAHGYSMAGEFTPSGAQLFARHSIELLAQALEELHHDHTDHTDAWRVAIFRRALQIIALRFGEARLSPDDIALDLSMSTRSLSRIFATQNETVMRCVFEERIRQAKRLLVAPECAHRSITQIAFTCGFSDSTHFGRVFLQQTQMTPSEWRKQRS